MRKFKKENGNVFTVYTQDEASGSSIGSLLTETSGVLTNDEDMDEPMLLTILNIEFHYLHLIEEIL